MAEALSAEAMAEALRPKPWPKPCGRSHGRSPVGRSPKMAKALCRFFPGGLSSIGDSMAEALSAEALKWPKPCVAFALAVFLPLKMARPKP